jgi:hypothetical protein
VFVSRSYEDAGAAALLPQLSLTGRSRCNEGNRLGGRTSFDIATSTAAARLTVLLSADSRDGKIACWIRLAASTRDESTSQPQLDGGALRLPQTRASSCADRAAGACGIPQEDEPGAAAAG